MKPRQYVARCREELQKALDAGDERQISLAMARLGLALFRAGMIKKGLARFDESVKLATSLHDAGTFAQCLAIKTSAYQIVERLPDAYQTAEEIRLLGERHGDPRMVCDALASQGQILLDSGEPVIAFEKLQEARQIVDQLGDQRRQMKLAGVFGNYCLAVASPDRAESYYEEALALAREIKDEQAELGFIGNLAVVLEWQGKNAAAVPALEEVLAMAQKNGDRQAEIHALRHLVQAHTRLENDALAQAYAQRGLELARDKDRDAAIAFLEALVRTAYRINEPVKARSATREAIAIADSIGDHDKELELTVRLGESYVIAEKLQDALVTYQEALAISQTIGRQRDEAHLTGRVGFTLAELGRLDEAIGQHQKSIELARQFSIPDLEGEQLSLLAIAWMEQGELEQARICASSAVEVYTRADLQAERGNARRLLAQIEAAGSQGRASS